MSFEAFFKGKTVTLLGLGLLGRGVGDAAFLAQYAKKLFITDSKSASELQPSIDRLKSFSNIDYSFGSYDAKIFSDVDFVIKGAGVRPDHQGLRIAQKNNVPVYMSTALFAKLSSLPVIGVTGTRGKTTTTLMIAEILKHACKNVLLGGNLRGVSTLAQLPDASQNDLALLELDSWQLQGFDDLKISPHIAVFTNFYPDHMNYYDNDMQRYFADKAAIFRHQKTEDTLVTTKDVTALTENKPNGHVTIADVLPAEIVLKIQGEHNRLNAGLARSAARAYGISEAIIDKALQSFTGVEGRLQFVARWQDRAIYNDNNATTQEATLAALHAFPPKSIVLIFGGSDKGLPMDKLLNYIAQHNIRCLLLRGTGSDRILQTMPTIPQVAHMKEAVNLAIQMSKPGDTIVLSPAFASFGLFQNEYDRNDQFMEQVKSLLTSSPA